MNYQQAEQLIESNPEAAKRFYQLEWQEWGRLLRDIIRHDKNKDLNPYYNLVYDIRNDCLEQSNKCKAEIWKQASEKSKQRMRVFKKDPQKIRDMMNLKEIYLDNQRNYNKFKLYSGLDITEDEYNNINVSGDFAKTMKNLYKLLK